MKTSRREFIQSTSYAALGAALVSQIPQSADAAAPPPDFDIDDTFARFMRDLGGSAKDGGGKVIFTGQDPILRSHFRIGTAMALPAMGAGVGAAAIWRERTGEGQDLKVDLRESVYNVNPLIGGVMRMSQAAGVIPAADPLPANFNFLHPSVNGLMLQAPVGLGNPMTFVPFETKDGRFFNITGAYPHLERAGLQALNVPPGRDNLVRGFKQVNSFEFEERLNDMGGVGVVHRTAKEWLAHPEGDYLAKTPLIEIIKIGDSAPERWGNARIQEVLRGQRDLYAHMNNQVLHYANQGVTINEIHNVYELPQSLLSKWFCRGYHGSAQHNSRGVIQRFLGFWDCNPATLVPLSPADSAPLYVEMMGGAKKILARGRKLHDEGKYLLAQEIVNKLVQAEPTNAAAKDLLADIFEQLGYQQENPGLRNSYLAAAYELRTGIPQGETADTSSPDVIRAMSTELFLNFLGIRMDSRKAEGMRFTINLITPDNGEKFLIELENATLTNIQGFLADKPDLTLTLNRTDLEQTMMGAKTLEAQIKDGTAKVSGDAGILKQLASTMIDFDPRFEIMPGTKTRGPAGGHVDPYEAELGKAIPE